MINKKIKKVNLINNLISNILRDIDFNNELISTINKKHNISILSFSILYPRFFFPGKNQFHNKSANFKKIKTINPYNPFSYLIINKYLKHVNPDVILSTHWNPFFSITYSIIWGCKSYIKDAREQS